MGVRVSADRSPPGRVSMIDYYYYWHAEYNSCRSSPCDDTYNFVNASADNFTIYLSSLGTDLIWDTICYLFTRQKRLIIIIIYVCIILLWYYSGWQRRLPHRDAPSHRPRIGQISDTNIVFLEFLTINRSLPHRLSNLLTRFSFTVGLLSRTRNSKKYISGA